MANSTGSTSHARATIAMRQTCDRYLYSGIRTMRYSICGVVFFGILAGCASVPSGPSVAVMPAPGKPFDQFAMEDQTCRLFAQQSIGMTPGQAAADSEVKSIAVGTAIGAAAGALAGGHNSAGTGAAVGLVSGAAMGSGGANYSGYEAQRRYDIAYEQCMYAKGNQLPQRIFYQPGYSQPPASPAPSLSYPPPPPPPSR